MRKLPFLFLILILASCGSSKKIGLSSKERKISVAAADKERRGISEESKPILDKPRPSNESVSKADNVINTALTFSGVRYKFGGTTRKGMDCSGLLYISFGEHDVQLPRTSIHMAEEGKK